MDATPPPPPAPSSTEDVHPHADHTIRDAIGLLLVVATWVALVAIVVR